MKAVNARIAVAVDTSLLLDDPRTPHWRSFCKSYAVMGKSCRLPNIVGYPTLHFDACVPARSSSRIMLVPPCQSDQYVVYGHGQMRI